MAALADEDFPALEPADLGDNVVDDPLHHPVAVEQAVVDAVEVAGPDRPRPAGRLHDGGVAHERVGLQQVIRDRGEEHVLGALHVDGELDVHAVDVLELLFQELA
ncbi:MAG: hypothetical protein ACYSUA_03700, partial [Planctomycetota bacterium]